MYKRKETALPGGMVSHMRNVAKTLFFAGCGASALYEQAAKWITNNEKEEKRERKCSRF